MASGVTRRLRAVRRLRSFSGRDLMRLVLAQWYLLRARLALLFRARGRLLAAVTGTDAAPDPDVTVHVQEVSLAVARAAEYGLFRPTCLVRSMALERFLRREGVQGAVVRIGARRNGHRIEMHAWIELAGAVVGESPQRTSTFAPLHDFTGAHRP